MEKFKNKYRIPSARATWWDYGQNGWYFITICTAEKEHFFGDVMVAMQLSAIGKIAQQCWFEIPQHFPFVKLDAFVVMPNHVHGIIMIDKTEDTNVKTQNLASLPFPSPTPSQPTPSTPSSNNFGPQSKNLASIIRGYKIGVTKNARLINPAFAWQPRFHDHIIRNSREYKHIVDYIQNNPSKWENDKFYG